MGKRKVKTKLTALAKAKAAQAMELDKWGSTCVILDSVLKLIDDSVVLRLDILVLFCSVIWLWGYKLYIRWLFLLELSLFYNFLSNQLPTFNFTSCNMLIKFCTCMCLLYAVLTPMYTACPPCKLFAAMKSLAFCFHDEVYAFCGHLMQSIVRRTSKV